MEEQKDVALAWRWTTFYMAMNGSIMPREIFECSELAQDQASVIDTETRGLHACVA